MTAALTSSYWQMPALAQDSGSEKVTSSAVREGQIEVVFKVPLDELAKKIPAAMTFYRCGPDKKAVQREALLEILGKDTHIEVHEASGGVFAGDMGRLWAKAPSIKDQYHLPDDKLIIERTEKFLDMIGGLSTDLKTVRRISVDTVELMDNKGERRSMPIGVNVTYRRILNGYEVIGPGGKLKIYHTTDGEVAGYQRVWRNILEEDEKQPVQPIEKAAELFRKDPLGRALLSDVKKVEVTDIRLAYHEQGIAESQQYLQPIYQFTCIAHVMKSDNEVMQVPYTRYMTALVKPPVPLWPGDQKYEPDKRPETLPARGED